jgi:serine protease Do
VIGSLHGRRYDGHPVREARCAVRVAALLLLAAATLIPERTHAQLLAPATFIPVSASVVRVQASRGQGRNSIGSGVVVAPSVVVTNCHVTRDATEIRISAAGQTFEVTGEHADGAHDVCFLHVTGWRGKPVALADAHEPRLGDPVAAIGFTGGMERSLHFGRVRGLHLFDGAKIIQSDAAFTSGASGGGLFDERGKLVGLLTFRSREPRNGFYALPVQWIVDRMPTDDQWTDIGPLADAAPFWQRDVVTQPYFMRAALLGVQQRWPDLIELTAAWAKADPDDAEPFRVRGDALRALDRGKSAVQAFNEALRLEPDNPLSWYGLALAYASIGDIAASEEAQSVTTKLDGDLASSLRDEIARLHRVQ